MGKTQLFCHFVQDTGASMQNVLLIDATEGRRSSGGIFSVSDLLPNTTCHLKLLAENEKGMGPEFIWHTTTDKGQLTESFWFSREKTFVP